ncbi:MAG: hypothetical protein ABI462_14185, partial [Ignavibacteria bacterium]
MESLIEKFIGTENINPFMFEISLLEKLTDQRLYPLFEKKYNSAKKKLMECKNSDNLYCFLLADIYSANLDKQMICLTKKDKYRKEWFAAGNELLKFFVKKLLTEIIFLLNKKQTLNADFKIPFISEINFMLENNDYLLDDLEIKLNYLMLKMLLEVDSESFFFQIKKLITTEYKALSKNLLKEAINNLQIFCFDKIMTGKDFTREEFDIANLRFELDINNEKEKMNIDVFFTFFSLSITLEEFEWAKSFIDKYSKSLDQKFQNNAIHYSYARLYYQNSEHDKALKELAR